MFGYRCKKCGKLHHPARLVCDKCGGREFAEEVLDGEGTLLTYTRVYNLPAGIDKSQLDFGIVEMREGVRASARLDVKGEVKTGMKLKATEGVVRVMNGVEHRGFIFVDAD